MKSWKQARFKSWRKWKSIKKCCESWAAHALETDFWSYFMVSSGQQKLFSLNMLAVVSLQVESFVFSLARSTRIFERDYSQISCVIALWYFGSFPCCGRPVAEILMMFVKDEADENDAEEWMSSAYRSLTCSIITRPSLIPQPVSEISNKLSSETEWTQFVFRQTPSKWKYFSHHRVLRFATVWSSDDGKIFLPRVESTVF